MKGCFVDGDIGIKCSRYGNILMNKKSLLAEQKEPSVKTGDQEKLEQNLSLLLTPQKSKPREIKTTEKSQNKFHYLKIDAPGLDLQGKEQSRYSGCNCKKSQCLKMYCVCFSFGKMCDGTCLCQACLNKSDNLARSEAINEIITKDPFAFSKVGHAKPQFLGDGCNCKRSNCSKKYCECFRNGRKCAKNCNCVDCENVSKEEQAGEPSKRVKLQKK